MDPKAKNKEGEADEARSASPAEELPVPVVLTSEQIEQLKERAAKADENWDRLLRQTADLENYKKRAARERQEAVAFANESLLLKLLPVLDAFEMALAAAANQAAGGRLVASRHRHGFQQLKSALADAGLEEIKAGGQAV